MHTFVEALKWIGTSSHWSGFDGIPVRTLEQVEIFLAAMVIAAAIAIPVGTYVGHTRRAEFLSVSVANVGRSIPSFALLVITYLIVNKVAPSKAFGLVPPVAALVALAIPPMVTNTYVAIQGIEPDTVEAARGMGFSEREVLLRLELPLAAPLVMAGIRTSAVTVIATVPLAALTGGGTLGRYIVDGFAQHDQPKLVAGAILVAVLSIVTEVSFGVLQRATTPRTTSARRRSRGASARQPKAA
jgi:osmoprotectant transport system permease protein